MKYLLDTNIISEIHKPDPNRNVIRWLNGEGVTAGYLSVITLGEIRKGIEKLPPGRRRAALMQWLEADIPKEFEGRILGIDQKVADIWGRIIAVRSVKNDIDLLIAATAMAYDLTLVTRNMKDFHISGLKLFNPWKHDA